jgi:hypothetical protein
MLRCGNVPAGALAVNAAGGSLAGGRSTHQQTGALLKENWKAAYQPGKPVGWRGLAVGNRMAAFPAAAIAPQRFRPGCQNTSRVPLSLA